MTPRQAVAFVRRHGVVLEAAAGPVPSLAEAVAGGPIRGSWWAHSHSHQIFAATRAVRELDLARDVRSKGLGALSVALGPEVANGGADLSLAAAYGPPIPDVYRAPLDVVFPQLVALFLALRFGLRPDAPSETGVIHRVVQGVKVYEP